MPRISLTDLDAVIEEFMEEWQVPGLAMAIVHEGEPVLIKAYGLRDVEAGLPVTTDTQFLLGNNTMSFTATGLGMLMDDGALDWTKPVRDYLPEFRLHDPSCYRPRDSAGPPHTSQRPTATQLGCGSRPIDHLPNSSPSSAIFEASGDLRSQFRGQRSQLRWSPAWMTERVSWTVHGKTSSSKRLLEPLGIKNFSYSAERP